MAFVMSGVVTVSLVAGPVTVRPLPGVRVLRKGCPPNFVRVSCTVTFVTPAAALAENDSAGDGWNWREPSGVMPVIEGCACMMVAHEIRKAAARLAGMQGCGNRGRVWRLLLFINM